MTYCPERLIASAIACAMALPVLAQDYRYPSTGEPPRQTTQQQSVQQQPQPQAVPAAPLCTNCGTVDMIRVAEQAGQASGVGMVAGGVLGGLLGHQIGHGSGNTAATIVGAAGGAYAGNQVEKNVKKVARYDVSVRMDDGTLRTVSYDAEPGFRSGDKVRFIDGRLTRN
jgi:outer membrane lipoprotein SlyB